MSDYVKLLQIEGNADDLLTVTPDGKYKSTRLIDMKEDAENGEICDLSFTSTSMNKEFNTFDKIIGKKIRITLEYIGQLPTN